MGFGGLGDVGFMKKGCGAAAEAKRQEDFVRLVLQARPDTGQDH